MHTETANDSSTSASVPVNDQQDSNLEATAPGQLRVIKRNGSVVSYDESKINIAITKAYLAVEGGNAAASSRVHETVGKLSKEISDTFRRRMPSGGSIHIEEIQDQVELMLMRSGEHKVARSYVIYRAEHAKQRAQQEPASPAAPSNIIVTMDDGSTQPLDTARLQTVINEACEGLEDVTGEAIYNETLKNLYSGVNIKDVRTSLVMTARTLVEQEPNYSYVAARLLLDSLRSEALRFLNITDEATQSEMHNRYAAVLKPYLEKGVELELLSPELLNFDLARLGNALQADRDEQFTYLGLQTLYDRYFIQSEGTRFELPQSSLCASPWGWPSMKKTAKVKPLSFII